MYSQTWANENLQKATTYLQSGLPTMTTVWSPNLRVPIWTTTTCQQRAEPHILGLEGGRYIQVWLYSARRLLESLWASM